MMRFAMTSAVTVVVATMVAVSMWPSGTGQVGMAAAQTRQADKNESVEDAEMIANAQTMDKLRKIGQVQFVDHTLGEVAEYFSNLGDFQVFLNMRALEEHDIGTDLPITCTLRDVPIEMLLRKTFEKHDLAYTIEHGVVIITTSDDADSTRIIRVYRVDDLVRPGKHAPAGQRASSNPFAAVTEEKPGKVRDGSGGGSFPGPIKSTGNADMDALIELIARVVDYHTWQQFGGEGTISEYRGALVIVQTMHTHMKIEKFLDDLRRAIPTEDER